ncbi:hypothetical protein DP113_17880 [Brasilonema octagenarum UFV-E1]|uniref:Uncharacterized protein n=2 Tax=Brasilonema TaxID=383614 RepID=A0A856ME98_9CYAN|nr:hypothetical protein [Brasilonema octagenarum UFV-OR1]QDL09523.1 hypothetical protein DP114_17945 [Brasilonema sennae CENA114]QDL15880.1 hypothetical protein DP113_17880 [Brasilonema octagenarum UFV-E1]
MIKPLLNAKIIDIDLSFDACNANQKVIETEVLRDCFNIHRVILSCAIVSVEILAITNTEMLKINTKLYKNGSLITICI